MTSQLSFQASSSVKSREDIKNLAQTNWCFQIMPGGRSVVSSKEVEEFPSGKNPNILIHSTYISRPFGDPEKSHIAKICLSNYAKISKKLGSSAILVHMPASPNELARFAPGLELIYDAISPYNGVLHLETEPLTKSLRDHIGLNEENALDIYSNYVDNLLKIAKNAMLVPDTAHLFANGLNSNDQIKFINSHLDRIKFIHFNGNSNYPLHSDKHTPIFAPNNKISNHESLTNFLAKLGKFCIVENSTEGSTRPNWVSFAEKFNFNIVPNFSCFSY